MSFVIVGPRGLRSDRITPTYGLSQQTLNFLGGKDNHPIKRTSSKTVLICESEPCFDQPIQFYYTSKFSTRCLKVLHDATGLCFGIFIRKLMYL